MRNSATDNPCPFWKRLLLKIPFFRNRMLQGVIDGLGFDDINIFLCRYTSQHVSKSYSEQKFKDIDIFVSRKYFRNVLKRLFGKNGLKFCDEMKFEWARFSNSNGLQVAVLNLPHTSCVGRAVCIGFVIDEINHKANPFTLERSVSEKMAVCEWNGSTHFYYDTICTKSEFVKKIVEIFKDISQ